MFDLGNNFFRYLLSWMSCHTVHSQPLFSHRLLVMPSEKVAFWATNFNVQIQASRQPWQPKT